ncbi:transporter substrate-binding domain-containing protein [Paludibacterium yongneupense]|uniref:transporter substrate-binding domain-containing protein n=1 Tax=Paludibacterium yongneupense TaxID=400061 RepID=UPI00040FB304|nr:transporter substrate-binding domain-containing protein [Paludibacterium yongneupense]
MSIDSDLIRAFAPGDVLRVTINLGNALLAKQDDPTAGPYGVSVDLAHALAQDLGIGLELQLFDGAGKAVEAVQEQRADLGFFAIDPLRGVGLHFTPPYVVIEGSYLVARDSPIRSNGDVDHPRHRVAVGRGSAYDLYLSRHLHQAQIVRAPTSAAVVDTMVEHGLDVAAGVRQQLEADAQRVAGLRLLDGGFMRIHQAMALPASRGRPAFDWLDAWLEAKKASGAIAALLTRHAVKGAAVAAPGYPSGLNFG